jgi:Leucine-rich repeat (LRR) protein
VWQVGAVARGLDLCNNPQLGSSGVALRGVEALSGLTRLASSSCGLRDAAVAWDSLCSLSRLQTLVLDHNALTRLPDALGRLTCLTRLSVAKNALVELPASLCGLSSLQSLDVSGNALTTLPSDLGSCSALEEVNLSENRVAALPASLANCLALKVLSADANHISCAGIPPQLLRAPALHTLSLHRNPVTIEELREIDGYAELDARRRAKADKVLDGRVLGATKAFDEGADAARNCKF